MKIMIVDDHPVMREGFAALLASVGKQTVVLQVSTVTEALRLLVDHADIDLVVLDLLMPGLGGFDAITQMSRAHQSLPLIVLSSSENPQDVRKALALGALGYVPKSASPTCLLAAIKLVINGDIYVPPLILGEDVAVGNAERKSAIASDNQLTGRQIEVLRLLADGLANRAIADRLDLSEKTVKAHVTAIFKALNVINRTQAAAAGRLRNLV